LPSSRASRSTATAVDGDTALGHGDEALEADVADDGLRPGVRERVLELGQNGRAGGGILFRFVQVAADDVALVPDLDLLDLERGPAVDRVIPPGPGQTLLGHRRVLPEPAAQDIVEGRPRVAGEQVQHLPGNHPAIGDHDHPADLKARSQGRDHLREGGAVVSVARQDVPGNGPAVAVDGQADHHLRLIGAPVARVAAPPQRALLRPPDERAGRVDEHQVQGLGEQVAIPDEELPLQLGPARRQEAAHRPVQMLKLQGVDARALDGAQPAHALEIAARRAQTLERQREARALEVEAEAASAGQAREDLGQPLLLPQAAEDQRRPPGPGGMGPAGPRGGRAPRRAGAR
jgi:hypothetical protein